MAQRPRQNVRYCATGEVPTIMVFNPHAKTTSSTWMSYYKILKSAKQPRPGQILTSTPSMTERKKGHWDCERTSQVKVRNCMDTSLIQSSGCTSCSGFKWIIFEICGMGWEVWRKVSPKHTFRRELLGFSIFFIHHIMQETNYNITLPSALITRHGRCVVVCVTLCNTTCKQSLSDASPSVGP